MREKKYLLLFSLGLSLVFVLFGFLKDFIELHLNKLAATLLIASILFFLAYYFIRIIFNQKENQKFQITKFLNNEDQSEILSSKSLNHSSENEAILRNMEAYRKEYIGNISHELKTPLFSIQGYIESLLDGAAEDTKLRDKYLGRVGISVERLLNIVKDLDMMNRLEAGELKPNFEIFDINQLIKETLDLLDLEAQNKHAHLYMHSSNQQLMVFADKQGISQVLINLISNAIYYSNRQEAKIVVSSNLIDQKVNISVSDNGMGIKSELISRIFERFYRIETSRNRKDGGSGLGLAIVKHILDAHNENIQVNSLYLEGTNFSFNLKKA